MTFSRQRRDFCKQALLSGGALSVASLLTSCAFSELKQFASAYTDLSGKHFVAWFDQNGVLLGNVEIPNRAHDLCHIAKKQLLLAFSRRPGNKLFVIDLLNKSLITGITSGEGKHFYGHGVTNTTGEYLYTTENQFDDKSTPFNGKIVVRNTQNFNVEAEFDSFGIGPHQLLYDHNRQNLVVANGGIQTHPKSPRAKLNLDTMRPNLSYINAYSGHLEEQVAPPVYTLSVRHLAMAKNGNVFIGCQNQGFENLNQPLIFSHTRSEALKPLKAAVFEWQRFKHYTGSLAINDTLNTLAVTSPRGGIVSYWNTELNTLKSINSLSDCSGIAPLNTGQNFIKTTGRGLIQSNTDVVHKGVRWDNHITSVT